jgi:glycosyltransferase involved in cell wall biosynthesis
MRCAKPVKVLFNALVLDGSRCGYGRVFAEMLVEFNRQNDPDLEITVLIQHSGFKSLELNPEDLPHIRFKILKDFPHKWIRVIFEQLALPIYAVWGGYDVIHMPATFGLIWSLKPVIQTFHTATSFVLPKSLRGRPVLESFLQNLLIRFTVRQSAVLVVISRRTAQELAEFLGAPIRYEVIYNGCPTTLVHKVPEGVPNKLEFTQNKNIILSVSQFYRLKNHKRVIEAFITAKDSGWLDDKFCLFVCGTIKERDYFEECLNLSLGRDDIHLLTDITDAELAYLYSIARVYVSVSLFEGFGLTPLEALSFNVPIVLSDIPIFKEIYGDGFIYVDPYSSSDIARGIMSALEQQYVDFCRNNPILHKYSWSSICMRYRDYYLKLGRCAR